MACHVIHHAAVVCAGRVLERAEIRDFDQAGRRAAWTVAHGGRIELREAKNGRIVMRRRVGGDQVAVTSRGDLAWAGQHVVLKPAGRRHASSAAATSSPSRTTARCAGRATTTRCCTATCARRRSATAVRGERTSPRSRNSAGARDPRALRRLRRPHPGDSSLRAWQRQDLVLDHTFASAQSQLGVAAIAGSQLLLWRTGDLSDGYFETVDAVPGRCCGEPPLIPRRLWR